MVNRIIGILVILAIGVLVSPFLLNHHVTSAPTAMINPPPFPDVQTQNDTIKALGARNRLVSKSNKTVATKKHMESNLKNAAWVIQVGTFRNKVNALQLVNQLRARGYKAFIHQKTTALANEEIHVFIGPEVKRGSAVLLALKLAKETKLSATIKAYKPLAA